MTLYTTTEYNVLKWWRGHRNSGRPSGSPKSWWALSIQPKIPEISVGTSNGTDHFGLVRPEYSGPALKVVHFGRSGHFGRSDRNALFHLTKSLSPVPLFCILTRTITKCAVAWVGSVQPKCTVPSGTGNFRNSNRNFCWMEGAQGQNFVYQTDTDDVKQKTFLSSLQGKICLMLFHGFCSFVVRHLCPVNEVNAEVCDQRS